MVDFFPTKVFVEVQAPWEGHYYSVKRVLYSGRTKYQQVDILELEHFGKTLVLDGKVQSSLYDEFVYHEALVHVPMLTHPNPRRVLVIGGGEGATIREVLKHPVERVVMVDIDEELVTLCKKYLPEMHQGSFDDPRVELVFQDGRKYVESAPDAFFDVVILDLTDPSEGGPAVYLYTKEFYQEIFRILNKEGVMVTQATPTYSPGTCLPHIYQTVCSVFPVVRAYHVYVLLFDDDWGFVLGSKRRDPLQLSRKEIEKRLTALHLRSLDIETFRAILTIPPHVRALMEKGEIATDAAPRFLPL